MVRVLSNQVWLDTSKRRVFHRSMISMASDKEKYLGILCLVLGLLSSGCRHDSGQARHRSPPRPVTTGDPATNVVIVPMSAGWKTRPGSTNPLPAGIVASQPLPFPEYDQALVKTVYAHWQDLLKALPAPDAQGTVVVGFELHSDGSVSRVNRLPSEVTPRLERLCERAIIESAPFAQWTPAMKTEIGGEARGIMITFDYNAVKK